MICASLSSLVVVGLLQPLANPAPRPSMHPRLRLQLASCTEPLDEAAEECPSLDEVPVPAAPFEAQPIAIDCLVSGFVEPDLADAYTDAPPARDSGQFEFESAPLDPNTGLLPAGIEIPVPVPPAESAIELPGGATRTELPSLRDLAAFCLPTLGIWLSSPLLSLIDTSVVGVSCATHHLAALAPSTKLCDYVAFFCSVIGAATTNLAADAFAKGEPHVAKRIIGSSLTISLLLGTVVAGALGVYARPLMAAMLGGAGSLPMLTAATEYTAIRALGYPAALLTMTLQSAFISTKDSRTPLLAVPIAACVNLVADLLVVPSLGAAGAAWATTLALYTNAATLLAMWARKLHTMGGQREVFVLPTPKEARQIFAFAAPMMVALIARVCLGLSITLSAVALGTTALAANQIIESLYWLFCPFGEAISLCMQAYLPPLLLQGRSLARRLQTSAFRAAGALGTLAAAGAVVLPLSLPSLFTSSAAVSAASAAAAPMLGFGLFSYVLACSAEGMLIARKGVWLRFLAAAHMVNALGFSLALRALVARPAASLAHVWGVFGVCNVLRLVQFTWALRVEDRAALADRAEEPRRWRRALRKLRVRVAALRRARRDDLHEQIPNVEAIAPHLLGPE